MIISSFSFITGFSTNSQTPYQISLGTYPQSEVTDSALLDTLNSLLDENGWKAYEFYEGENSPGTERQTDYTFYEDVRLSGVGYRAVTFTQYRPEVAYNQFYKEGANPNEKTSAQYKNGYFKNTVYWFRYDPVIWTVYDDTTGFALCNTVIDTMAVNDTETDDLAFADTNLFSWLNGEFTETAFTQSDTGYISGDIRIPEISVMTGTAYDFNTETNRIAASSDYAKCLGVKSGTISSLGIEDTSFYWIDDEESPAPDSGPSYASTYYCDYMGSCLKTTMQSNYGVRPAINVDLTYDKSDKISVTYFYDPTGSLQHTDYYLPGETITPYAVGSFDGYTFEGWDTVIPAQAGNDNLVFRAKWAVPKLIPDLSTENSKNLVIERINNSGQAFAETGNNGVLSGTKPLPQGVTLSEKPFSSSYGDYQTGSDADYDSWFIYGVDQYTTPEELKALIKVSAGGHCEITNCAGTYVGTGTIVKVFDSNDNLVEQFRVVVYGDLDNSGSVTSSDTNIAIQESKKPSWSKASGDRVEYMFRAANVDQSISFSSSDANLLIMCNKNKAEIDQVSGMVKSK
jgi:hypothetical protein